MEANPLPDFRSARVAAGGILSRKSNRLKLMEGIVVCLMAILLSFLLSGLFRAVVNLTRPENTAETISRILFEAFIALYYLFAVLPLLIGLSGMAAKMAKDASVSLAELFSPFSGGKAYRVALRSAFRFFWTVGLMILAVRGTLALFDLWIERSGVGIAVLAGFTVVGEVILWLVLAMRQFPTLSLILFCGMTVRDARSRTRSMKKRARKGGLVWLLSFLPWILLGLLTFGILLLCDILPRMCISYFLYSDQLTESVISPEVTNHE